MLIKKLCLHLQVTILNIDPRLCILHSFIKRSGGGRTTQECMRDTVRQLEILTTLMNLSPRYTPILNHFLYLSDLPRHVAASLSL